MAVLAGKISGTIAPRREEGEGDLGAKLPENNFDHALFSLRDRLFEHKDWPLLHEEAM